MEELSKVRTKNIFLFFIRTIFIYYLGVTTEPGNLGNRHIYCFMTQKKSYLHFGFELDFILKKRK